MDNKSQPKLDITLTAPGIKEDKMILKIFAQRDFLVQHKASKSSPSTTWISRLKITLLGL